MLPIPSVGSVINLGSLAMSLLDPLEAKNKFHDPLFNEPIPPSPIVPATVVAAPIFECAPAPTAELEEEISLAELCAAAEEPEDTTSLNTCWGGVLKDDWSECDPSFVSGKAHFKNKFCPMCRSGIAIPSSRVRALTPELKSKFSNSLRSGFWNDAPKSVGGGEIRIVNNTITCDGPPLVVYRSTSKANDNLKWGKMPAEVSA